MYYLYSLTLHENKQVNGVIQMAEIVNFRPTAEAALIIARQKEEGTNVSRWINNLITGKGNEEKSGSMSIYTLPENGIDLYDSRKMDTLQMVTLHSVPFSRLSIKRHKEARGVIESCGMEYHYFRVDADNYISIIAVNREEASMEFARYYAKVEGEYVRTSVPLPSYRFDVENKVVIIIASDD